MKRAAFITILLILQACTGRSPRESIVLKNGLRTMLVDRRSQVASAMFILNGGISAGDPGVMRLTTHLLLRGTTVRTAEQIHEEIEMLGGRIDARSDIDFSYVLIEAPNKHFLKCFDMFCEILEQPAFEEEQIAQAMQQKDLRKWEILIEKGEYKEEYVRPLLFKGSPVSRKFEEQKETVTREEILRHYDRWFRPDNGILVISGRTDRRSVLEMASNLWARKEKGPSIPMFDLPLGENTGTREVIPRPGNKRDVVQIGFRAPAIFSGSFVETTLLSLLLGSGKNSVLSRRWNAEGKYNYFMESYYIARPSLGFVVIILDVPAGKSGEAVDVVMEEAEKLKSGEIPSELVTIAKRKAISNYSIMLTEYSSFNLYFGIASLIDAPYRSLDDLVEAVKPVTPEQLRSTVQDVFQNPAVYILQGE